MGTIRNTKSQLTSMSFECRSISFVDGLGYSVSFFDSSDRKRSLVKANGSTHYFKSVKGAKTATSAIVSRITIEE